MSRTYRVVRSVSNTLPVHTRSLQLTAEVASLATRLPATDCGQVVTDATKIATLGTCPDCQGAILRSVADLHRALIRSRAAFVVREAC